MRRVKLALTGLQRAHASSPSSSPHTSPLALDTSPLALDAIPASFLPATFLPATLIPSTSFGAGHSERACSSQQLSR